MKNAPNQMKVTQKSVNEGNKSCKKVKIALRTFMWKSYLSRLTSEITPDDGAFCVKSLEGDLVPN